MSTGGSHRDTHAPGGRLGKLLATWNAFRVRKYVSGCSGPWNLGVPVLVQVRPTVGMMGTPLLPRTSEGRGERAGALTASF